MKAASLLLLALCLLSSNARSRNPFDGTWMIDTGKNKNLASEKPVEQANVREGKIVFIVTLEVTPDGKTIHASSKSKEGGNVMTWTLHKQSE